MPPCTAVIASGFGPAAASEKLHFPGEGDAARAAMFAKNSSEANRSFLCAQSRCTDEGAIDRLLLGEDILKPFDQVAAALFKTVVKIVGTPNTFAVLARPTTLLTIIVCGTRRG